MSVSLVAVQETRLPVGAIYSIAIRDCDGCETHFFTSLNGNRHEITFRQLTDGGGFRALEQLRSSGSIHAFGLGVNETAICLEAMKHAHLDVILLAGRYTLLEQNVLDALLPACVRGTL